MDNLLPVIIGSYLLVSASGYVLEVVNLRHLKKGPGAVPAGFEGEIDGVYLKRAELYSMEKARFGILTSLLSDASALVFIFYILSALDGWVASLGLSFTLSGLVFFLVLMLGERVLSAPLGLYATFVIEKRHGFSSATPRLWAADFLKSTVISAAALSAAAYAGLWIVEGSPGFWWLWLWAFLLAFGVFLAYLSPYVIEPLFNRFEPIPDQELSEGISEALEKAGIRVKRVLKVDASKRTLHTNAYFTGIGRVKRIVLYDTLLEKLGRNEIIAVLAHEAGHWRKRHLFKGIVVFELIALFVLFLSHRLVDGDFLTRAFAMPGASFYAKVVLIAFLGSIVSFPFTPLFSYLSRRHEKEADDFAIEVSGSPAALAAALVKLSKDNLANLNPHPIYAAFYYSHPPVVERVRRLKEG